MWNFEIDGGSDEAYPWLYDGAPDIWCLLTGDAILALARCNSDAWGQALDQVGRWKLPKAKTSWPLRKIFVMLTTSQRTAVLRALPVFERALIFENFASNASLLAWQGSPAFDFQDPSCAETFARREISGIGCSGASGPSPLSAWCAIMKLRQCPEDLSMPPRLVQYLAAPVLPQLVTCNIRCRCPNIRFRCGGVLTLGSSTYPGGVLFCLYFMHDSVGRTAYVGRGSEADVLLSSWEDGCWYRLVAMFDWHLRRARVRLESAVSPAAAREVEVFLTGPKEQACAFISMHSVAADFEVSWTDLLVLG